MHARDMSPLGFGFKMSIMEKLIPFWASAIQNIIMIIIINLGKWSTCGFY
jgi:hypothetical protein